LTLRSHTSVRSTTRRVDPGSGWPDETGELLFASPRRTLRGWGTAAVIELPAPWVDHVDLVRDALAAYDMHDEVGGPGSGPVAFGALPFDRSAPARLVVPARLEGSTPDGDRWLTEIDGAVAGGAPEPTPLGAVPTAVAVRAPIDPQEWSETVVDATRRMVAGDLAKVVLARELIVTSDVALDPRVVADRLSRAHPGALRFLVDGFCGASPELLVSRVGDVVRAQPMAGTTPRSGDPQLDSRRAADLLASSKNREEHQITIDMVHETLLPWCSYLDAEPEPSVVAAASVQHLATLVEGRLSEPPPSVLELVAALHPTPAVGGWPRAESLALIDEIEVGDRGRYAGPVGWVDAAGNGSWAVGIRSVSLDGTEARLWAGVGVVADSDPEVELEETRAKFAATLQHLVRL
jgi:menaquinone-specific isochorismate synthase